MLRGRVHYVSSLCTTRLLFLHGRSLLTTMRSPNCKTVIAPRKMTSIKFQLINSSKCWKEGKGLTFWNSQARGPPQLQSDGTFGYDVVLITANTLTRSTGDWVLDSKYHTIIADEAHDFLRGQQHSTSNTLKTWF